MILQLQAHLTDTFYGVNFVSSLSHPCLTVNPASHAPCFEPWPQKGMYFPDLHGAGSLEQPQEPQEGVRKAQAPHQTPPVTHRNLNYHQVKQKTWGEERIPNLPLTSSRCNPQPQRDPGCEELRITRHFQWENPLSWESQHTVQPSPEWACSASLCHAVSTETRPGLRAHHRHWAPQGASLQQLAGSGLHSPPLQQKYKFKNKSRKTVYEEHFIWVEVGTGCKLPWDI